MPEGISGLGGYFRKAVRDVEKGLAAYGVKYVRIADPETELPPFMQRFGAAWAVEPLVNGCVLNMWLCVHETFPFSPPSIFLHDASLFLKIPHVEKTGRLCLIPSHGTLSPDNPAGVVQTMLVDAIQLISDGLSGRNQGDFVDEFESYWEATAKGEGMIISLVEPSSPSREIFFWQGMNLLMFSEDEDMAQLWLKRVFREDTVKNGKTGHTVLIWRDEALAPAQYPETNFDVRQLANESTPSVLKELIHGVRDCNARNVPVLLCFGTKNGPGMAALDLTTPQEPTTRGKPRPAKVGHGFRSIEKTPSAILESRYLSRSGRVIRKKSVQRVDPEWILNRGGEGFGALFDKHVCVIGCGAIGASMAWQLAQAGVGQLTLVDHDIYSWDNAARHILTGVSIGVNKAEAVAAHIMRQMPQVDVEAHKLRWEDVWREDAESLQVADLIISSTGSWESELALNILKKTGALAPPLLFVWTEAYALAGHSLLVTSRGGCLACEMGATGIFYKRALDWGAEGDKMKRVPACGGFFQPYGIINISAVRRMGAEHAIHVLLGNGTESSIWSWVASKNAISERQGVLRAEFRDFYDVAICGDQVLKANWPVSGRCRLCSEKFNDVGIF